MIIDDFHVKRSWGAFRPFKTNPPLIVDTDAVLSLAIPLEPFKPVAGRVQCHEPAGGMKPVKPQHGLPLDRLKRLDPFPLEKGLRPFVAKI
jgi:hypothetical protein